MNTKKLLVTTNEFTELEKDFSNWFDNSSLFDMYKENRGICKGIVMEYIANKQGKTIFTHLATRSKVKYYVDCNGVICNTENPPDGYTLSIFTIGSYEVVDVIDSNNEVHDSYAVWDEEGLLTYLKRKVDGE